jgi:hypothetical protein
MALQSGAFERLREFSSPGVLLRTLLLHVARGYSLQKTAVRAKLAHRPTCRITLRKSRSSLWIERDPLGFVF